MKITQELSLCPCSNSSFPLSHLFHQLIFGSRSGRANKACSLWLRRSRIYGNILHSSTDNTFYPWFHTIQMKLTKFNRRATVTLDVADILRDLLSSLTPRQRGFFVSTQRTVIWVLFEHCTLKGQRKHTKKPSSFLSPVFKGLRQVECFLSLWYRSSPGENKEKQECRQWEFYYFIRFWKQGPGKDVTGTCSFNRKGCNM